MSRTNTNRTLQNAKYSFDPARNAWFCGKKPVDESDVLIHLIRYAKSQNITDAGEWAGAAINEAKTTPELTTAGFVKAHMVRNRNRRIAGKYLFQNWARAVGIEITGKLEEFMARNSLLVSRFYNEIAAGYECCKKQARIAGRVMRSVFIGWELRDEDADEADRQVRRRAPKSVNPVMQAEGDGLRRHMEFMRVVHCRPVTGSVTCFCGSEGSDSYRSPPRFLILQSSAEESLVRFVHITGVISSPSVHPRDESALASRPAGRIQRPRHHRGAVMTRQTDLRYHRNQESAGIYPRNGVCVTGSDRELT